MSSGFRLRDGEQPILRRYATLAEYRNVSPGHSFQSLSVPIGYGMYYRIGASNPKTGNIGLVPVDSGLMLITTHAIYFGGDRETFRIDYDSILRLEAYKDGFGLHQNYGSAKVFTPSPIISVDEGWYFYNLIDSLSKW